MARKQVLVQLDDDLVDELDAAAEEEGLSRSELIRTAARALLESRVISRAEAALVASYRRRAQDPASRRDRSKVGRRKRPRVVKRGEIYWADLGPPAGRRPVLVLTRDIAIPVLSTVVVAPLTTTIRDIRTEVPLGPGEGLPDECVANCDNLFTVPKAIIEGQPVGRLKLAQSMRLDDALRFSLDIRY